MQHSDIPVVGVWFEPIFSQEFDISGQDYADLQKHIFSKIPVFSQEQVQTKVSQECRMAFIPTTHTTYIFRITDFKKKERPAIVDILHYKLPFASKKLLSNEQHVYEIKIEICQKAKQLYHLCITMQTETQVKNHKKLQKLEADAGLLKKKRKEDQEFITLLARAKAQNTRYILGALEAQPHMLGDLRDWNSTKAVG